MTDEPAGTQYGGLGIRLLALAADLGLVFLVAAALLVGRWWLYPVLWLGPWLTVWRVINRLRAIAEHGGMMQSKDRRQTTHHVRQTWIARFVMVPLNTGWHLAHHVDMGVPFQHLPQLHDELVADGEKRGLLAIELELAVGGGGFSGDGGFGLATERSRAPPPTAGS